MWRNAENACGSEDKVHVPRTSNTVIVLERLGECKQKYDYNLSLLNSLKISQIGAYFDVLTNEHVL